MRSGVGGIKRCRKRCSSSTATAKIDHISTMPDEILVCILSLLTVKQAAVTSVLSSRWRDLWKFNVMLSFDFADISGELAKFVECVNSVLELHKGPTIKKFKVRGFLRKRSASSIDSWISAALAKNVETLELDLDLVSDYTCRYPRYTFPFALFSRARATCLKNLTLVSCLFSPQQPFDCFKSLVTLTLKDFFLKSDVINNIISHCPLLEHFYLAQMRKLVSLKVTHLRLKYLKVTNCYLLRDMDIEAPNLISFIYQGPYVELSITCGLPLLDVQYISHFLYPRKSRVTYLFRKFITYISQLKSFAFQCSPKEVQLSFLKTLPTCTLSNLTELVIFLESDKNTEYNVLPCTLFLQMAPFLCRFELHNSGQRIKFNTTVPDVANWEQHVCKDVPHQFLKEVLLSGFQGYLTEMKLSMYLLHNCVTLEKFTIDMHRRILPCSLWAYEERVGGSYARECAELLSAKKPPQVVMSIL